MRKTEGLLRMEWTKQKGAIQKAVSGADRSDNAALSAITAGLDLLAEQLIELTKHDDRLERERGNL
jgi:hypothetical protein